jgi:hypothetical protein
MIVVDQEMLGAKFLNTLFNAAGNLAVERGLDKNLIMTELWSTTDHEDLVGIIEKHFGDEIIVR